MQATLEIRFAREDFEPALTNAGIDAASITDEEWRPDTHTSRESRRSHAAPTVSSHSRAPASAPPRGR